MGKGEIEPDPERTWFSGFWSTVWKELRSFDKSWENIFLAVDADVIREVNNIRDMNGMSFARKAMLQCGLGMENGVWKRSLLKKELQEIVREHRRHFEVKPVPDLEEKLAN